MPPYTFVGVAEAAAWLNISANVPAVAALVTYPVMRQAARALPVPTVARAPVAVSRAKIGSVRCPEAVLVAAPLRPWMFAKTPPPDGPVTLKEMLPTDAVASPS